MKIDKRTAKSILVCAALTAMMVPALDSPSFAQTQANGPASKPNILFIMGDDIGWIDRKSVV